MSNNTLSFEAFQAKVNEITVAKTGQPNSIPEFLHCMAWKSGMTPEKVANDDIEALQNLHNSNVATGVHPDLSNLSFEDIMAMAFASSDSDEDEDDEEEIDAEVTKADAEN